MVCEYFPVFCRLLSQSVDWPTSLDSVAWAGHEWDTIVTMDAAHLCSDLDSFRGFIYKPLTSGRCGSGFLPVFCRDVHFPSIIAEGNVFSSLCSLLALDLGNVGLLLRSNTWTESSFSDLTVQLEAQFIQKRKAACWLTCHFISHQTAVLTRMSWLLRLSQCIHECN